MFDRREQVFGRGVSEADLLMLGILATANRALQVSSVCFESGLSTTTALRRLKQLEMSGLIGRYRDPHDGRRHFVRLTDLGRERIGMWAASLIADFAD